MIRFYYSQADLKEVRTDLVSPPMGDAIGTAVVNFLIWLNQKNHAEPDTKYWAPPSLPHCREELTGAG